MQRPILLIARMIEQVPQGVPQNENGGVINGNEDLHSSRTPSPLPHTPLISPADNLLGATVTENSENLKEK